MRTIIYQYCFGIPNLMKMDCHQFLSYSIAQSALIYSLLNHDINFLLNENHLSRLKLGAIVRMRTDEEKTWDKKKTVLAPNDRPRS